MIVRGARRRKAVDRGFVLSDHADWTELQIAIRETHAETVFVTHGFIDELVRWLNEDGTNARPLQTQFVGEEDALEDVLAADFFEKEIEN
jgi:putative mRNA 3-end processing factor